MERLGVFLFFTSLNNMYIKHALNFKISVYYYINKENKTYIHFADKRLKIKLKVKAVKIDAKRFRSVRSSLMMNRSKTFSINFNSFYLKFYF